MVYQQMLFAQLTLPKNMYLRDMFRYVCQTICIISYVVCQTICNIICSYICIYIYLSTQSILPNFTSRKCRSHGHLRQHRFHQETQLLSVVRRHLSLVLESLSPHVHNIVYKYSYMRIYVHTINAIRRSFVYIYI